jgi:hypothetical protein
VARGPLFPVGPWPPALRSLLAEGPPFPSLLCLLRALACLARTLPPGLGVASFLSTAFRMQLPGTGKHPCRAAGRDHNALYLTRAALLGHPTMPATPPPPVLPSSRATASPSTPFPNLLFVLLAPHYPLCCSCLRRLPPPVAAAVFASRRPPLLSSPAQKPGQALSLVVSFVGIGITSASYSLLHCHCHLHYCVCVAAVQPLAIATLPAAVVCHIECARTWFCTLQPRQSMRRLDSGFGTLCHSTGGGAGAPTCRCGLAALPLAVQSQPPLPPPCQLPESPPRQPQPQRLTQ